MIKAIIFDFGRVISAQKPEALFQGYEKALGLAPGKLNEIMFESPSWQEALIGKKTYDAFWYAIGPDLGLQTVAQIDAFRLRYQADEAINKGIRDLLYKLYGRLKLAVLSNSPPGLSKWLDDWGILNLFDVVFCSGDEGMAKPNPAVYKRTLQRLDVLPNEAVFIDDALENVTAARQVGIYGITFTTAEKLNFTLKQLIRL
jgi:putative hydrolase of the HAD superfamily